MTVSYITHTGSVRALGGIFVRTGRSGRAFNGVRDATSIPAGVEAFLTDLQNALHHVLNT